jgi:metal-responsive CopG/Arc/MetJ family transcriptional regulator
MKSLSLKIEDSIINETDELIKDIKISRNQYIIQAIAFYNKIKKRKKLEARMKRAVNAVGNSSLEVLHEFELLEGKFDDDY